MGVLAAEQVVVEQVAEAFEFVNFLLALVDIGIVVVEFLKH